MMPFPLFLALKYLRPQRSFLSIVTVISIFGVLLGVAILVIVMAVMTGFDNMWREKILSFKPHVTVTSHFGVIENEEELCAKLDKVPGITGVAPVVQTLAIMQYDERVLAPVVLGVAPDRAGRVSQIPTHMHSGVFSLEGNHAVIGIDMASGMGLQVGDKALIHSPQNVMSRDELYLPEEVVIAGIYDMGMRDFDSGFVLTSLDVARQLVGLDAGAHSLFVMTEDAFRFEEFERRVEESVGPDCQVRTWRDVDNLLFQALSHEKSLLGALLAVITIVAVFCVTNTLIVITYQKTGEIGLLKALGVPSWRIMAAFVIHGWIQCAVGVVLGIGAGLLVLNNLAQIAGGLARINVNAFPKEIYGLSEIPWQVSAGDITFVSVFVMVFCTLISLVPAARAVWLDPVEAFRQE